MQGILLLVDAGSRSALCRVEGCATPLLTTIAILIIGVGVGASTTVFSVVNALRAMVKDLRVACQP